MTRVAAPSCFCRAGRRHQPGLAQAAHGRYRTKTRARLVKQASSEAPVPEWLSTPGEPLAPADTADAEAEAKVEPLFGRRTGRAILTGALGSMAEEGEIDVERIVVTLSEARPLTAVPLLFGPTLRHGVEVLVDVSVGLDPFRGDVSSLLQALGDLLADDVLDVSYFNHCPGRGITRHAGRRWCPWSPAFVRAPVLVVSDLGIGGPLEAEERASTEEWLQVARAVRGTGRAMLALVPYEGRRWPPALARAMTLLHWSERTTAGEIRRAVGRRGDDE